MKSSKADSRRCRPLLGTFVEVSLSDEFAESEFLKLHQLAFAQIEKVDRLMSFHRVDSDLSRLNRAKPGNWIALDPWCIDVLKAAEELFYESDGVFSIACGTPLMNWGLLPDLADIEGLEGELKSKLAIETDAEIRTRGPGFEVQGSVVRRLDESFLDLGGIAKGFAVDRAVDALQGFSGIVNAGGDLRVFGNESRSVQIRSGARENSILQEVTLLNCALATSSVHPILNPTLKKPVSIHVEARTEKPFLVQSTASVQAPNAMVADSLTKVALMASEEVLERCLRSQNALAWKSQVNVLRELCSS